MNRLHALVWTIAAVAAIGAFCLPQAARAAGTAAPSCGHSKASDDDIAAANDAFVYGNYMLGLQYQFRAQVIDEYSAGAAGNARAQAVCFSGLLVTGVELVQSEESYWQSSQAWNYARHLASLWQSYQGYKLPPDQQATYTGFFAAITQALRACYPDCDVSDRDVAQTKLALLEGP